MRITDAMWKKILPLPKKLFEQEDESPTVREEAALAERVTSKVTSAKQELLIACEQGDLALLDASLSRLDRATALSTKDSQSWPLLAIAGMPTHFTGFLLIHWGEVGGASRHAGMSDRCPVAVCSEPRS